MLVEVLVSILIFALGCVALLGLQARSFNVSQDIQTRAEAMQLANSYIGEMWAANLGSKYTPIADTSFLSGGSCYTAFAAKVERHFPDAVAPIVTIDTPSDLGATARKVSITLQWPDKDRPDLLHSYSQVSVIGVNG
jgi:type II secretory pathway pseudopilin PulG